MRNAVLCCILFWAALIAGCAAMTGEDKALAGQGADISATAVGLAMGAAEANPLGIGLLGVKYVAYQHIKAAPAIEQPGLWSAYGALGWGAAANNVCVIAVIVSGGTAIGLCPALGLFAGLGMYSQDGPTRHRATFDAICDAARVDRPGLVCVY